ncbi:MAG: FAD-dependent monooxygenase [Pseudomonadota bacterium]|nr:FAD-dependent monooxygenase [Pseudomonadota bacterium]
MDKKVLQTDVVISGGGPVGLMLAIGLSQKGFQVVLAEKFKPVDSLSEVKNSFDGRVLALSYGSKLILEQLELWSSLSEFVTAIQHVHVSQKGYLGMTKLHADEAGVPALGYSVQSSDLGHVLWQKANQQENITILCPASLQDFQQDESAVTADIEIEGELLQVEAKLIVGADGTDSRVRKILDLPLEEKSYQAYGVIAQIETEQHPLGWSYERFTEQGPVALLPMHGHFHKAVMVCPEDQIEEIKSLTDEQFIERFADKMGERLGCFVSVSPRMAYPLKETYVPQMVSGRAILMGNASHTQHPVAAQGLNLGIRDIGEFLAGLQTQQDLNDMQLLQHYADSRKQDHEKVMGLTDSLIQVFQHTSPLVGHLRGIGLMAMQVAPKLRKRFTKFAMGGSQS